MTNSTKAFPTVTLNNDCEFEIKPFEEMTFKEKDSLTSAMIDYTGGSVNMNSEVNYILKMEGFLNWEQLQDAPFTREDITNNEPTANIETKSGWEDMTDEERDSFVESLTEEFDSLDDGSFPLSNELRELQRLIEDAENADIEDYPEIMQWFMLDDRILSRLEEAGQCTLVGQYWGRQAYGQSITMDHCMQKACYDLASVWAN